MAPQLLPPAKKKIGAESGSIIKASTFIPEKKKKIKSSAIIKADPTGIVKQDKESTAIVKQFGGANKSLVKITNLVQTDLKEDTKKYKKDKEEKAKEKDKKKKEDIEKRLESGFGLKIPSIGGLKIPGIKAPGFFNRIFEALMWLGLGWIVDKLLDKESWFNKIGEILLKLANFLDKFLPKVVEGIFDFAAKAFPFVTGAGKLLFDSLAFMLDSVVKPYDQLRGFIGDKYGEEGIKQFDGFLGKLDKFIDGLIIFATAQTLLDDGGKPSKAPKVKDTGKLPAATKATKGVGISPPSAITKPSDISRYLKKDPKSLSTLRKFGPNAQRVFDNSFENALAKGKTLTQARRTASAAVEKVVKAGKITPQKLSGLAGAGQKAGKVFSRGFGRSAGRLGIKILGKAGLQTAKKTLGRMPVVGPLLVALMSLIEGEPIGKALFKGVGSSIGTAVGGAIGAVGGPLSIVGSIAGAFIGEFLGEAFYELFMGGGVPALKKISTNAARSVVRLLLRSPKLIADGFSSLIKTLGNVTPVVIDFLQNIWKSVSNFDYGKFFSTVWSNVVETSKFAWTKLTKLIAPYFENILGPKFGAIFKNIISRLGEYKKNPLLIVKDIFINAPIEIYKRGGLITIMNDYIFKPLIEQGSKIDWGQLFMDMISFVGKGLGKIKDFVFHIVGRSIDLLFEGFKQSAKFLKFLIIQGGKYVNYLREQLIEEFKSAMSTLYKVVMPYELWQMLSSFAKMIPDKNKMINDALWAIGNLPLVGGRMKNAFTAALSTATQLKKTFINNPPAKSPSDKLNEIKNYYGGVVDRMSKRAGQAYQSAMKPVFDFANFEDPKEDASLRQFYSVENKNKGGLVGLNDGGIAASGGALNFNVSGKGWGANATISGAGAGGNYQAGLGLQRNFAGRTANEGTIQEGITKVIEGLGPNLNMPSTAETSIPTKASTVVTLNLDWSGTLGKKQKLEYEKEEDNDPPPPPTDTKKPNDKRMVSELSLPSLRLAKLKKDRFGPPGSPTEYRSIDPKENEMFRNRPDVHLRRTQQANIALEHGDASALSLRRAFTPMGVPFDPISAKAFGYHVAVSNANDVDYRYQPGFHARDLARVEDNLNVFKLKKDESGVPLRASKKVESWDSGVQPEAWEQTSLNRGGIVSAISKNIGGAITPKPSMPSSSIKPSISSKKSLIPAPSKGTSLSTPSMSPRYDVSKFNRSLDYEDSTQVIERAVVIVKPVVIR